MWQYGNVSVRDFPVKTPLSVNKQLLKNKVIFTFQGGDTFVLILKEHLPSNTDEGYYAKFGFSAPVVLTKVNQVNLKGTIPGKVFFFLPLFVFSIICSVIHHLYSLSTTADPSSMEDTCHI